MRMMVIMLCIGLTIIAKHRPIEVLAKILLKPTDAYALKFVDLYAFLPSLRLFA